MRKIILNLEPNDKYFSLCGNLFNYFEEISLIKVLNVDFVNFTELFVAKVKLNDGILSSDVEKSNFFELFEIISEISALEYICLIKFKHNKNIDLFNLFNVDGIFDCPLIIGKYNFKVSIISSDENLKLFKNNVKKLGNILKISCNNYNFVEANILNSLSQRQEEILFFAYSKGYFCEPRKISGKDIAKELGLSKETVNEHLRKIFNKFVFQLLQR